MKKKVICCFIAFTAMLSFISCDYFPIPIITFKNGSDSTVRVLLTAYPDTIFPEGWLYPPKAVPAFSEGHVSFFWEEESYIRGEPYEVFVDHPIVYLYVFSFDMPIDSCRSTSGIKHYLLKCYEMDRQYAEDHNWTITYP